MKNKLLLLLMCVASVTVYAQENYQYFKTAGFKVKCGCSLYVNNTFIQMAKQQGTIDIIGAYICAENKEDYNSGVIININIYDESKSYTTTRTAGYSKVEKAFLDSYAANLAASNLNYQYISYKGVNALQYSFSQNGLPTKAIVFVKNKKSYLIQLATRKNLQTKYSSLIQSFEFY